MAIKSYLSKNRKKFLVIGGSVLSILILANAVNGFNGWRAQRHVQNACHLLYPIGSLLKENMSYGEGISYLRPSGVKALEDASIEAEKAGHTSGYYEMFQHQVFSLEMNLKGKVSEQTSSVYSPYALWTYGIKPTCNQGLNFIIFDMP